MKFVPQTTVAAVVSHPIQHFAPLYRAVNDRNLDLRVLFLSRAGLDRYHDRGFGTQVQWNSDVTDGYRHEFLADLALRPDWQQPNACRRAAGRVWAALDRLRPECVLIYGYRHTFNLAALAWCRRRRVPALMTSDSELLGRRSTRARIVKRLALPPLLRSMDAFLTIGDNNEAYLAAYGVPRSRMFRVPLTTDEAALREAMDQRDIHRRAVRADLGIDPAALVALFAGKLIDRKRPLDLADALRELARRPHSPQAREVVVVMAGDGQLRPALEEAAAELDGALRLVGFADQRQLPRLYAASDLYVHPAQRDPHPLAVKEAVLSGLPVVVSDRVGSVGPTDDVRPGRNGRVYPVGDVTTLAGILDELRRGPDLLAEMARESEKAIGDIELAASVEGLLRAVSAVRSPHGRGSR
ncbi:putative glycosyl transferase [Frankia canadensis]|uniref:Putative glycosyl transferase n=1 Tax=Frankia canadensis TaxID=1836972 RepID=A0A2I2KZL2_9ACTN|nr:glycosyltransferase family 4 protein [Frankia canadensis]SNQ51103.1 putative glycosyl transferase [Frankia canadensis]SOU58393.1 putative glycosyl transferase [Frankia canadensis]